jgi:histidyl-tRNA synthetase
VSDNAKVQDGVSRLKELLNVVAKVGIPENRIQIDLSIARGLDYYTGTIYETFLNDLPSIGSVCSGGRYDNLAGLYTKQVLPGVGASLGVDRLLAAMEEIQHPWLTGQSTPAPVLILNMDSQLLGDYQKIGQLLRNADIGVEVYPESKKLGQQFQFAEKRGHKIALIMGSEEQKNNQIKVKDLAKREETVCMIGQELVDKIQSILKTKT